LAWAARAPRRRPAGRERRAWCRLEFVEELERRDAGGHGQWVAAERAGLVDRTERREQVHDVGSAAEGTDRQAAADDFA